MSRGGAPYVFGIGHGNLGDEDNRPSNVGDNWETGNTLDAFKAGWSQFSRYKAQNQDGAHWNLFGFVGLGVYATVGEWNHAIGYGDSYFTIHGRGLIDVVAPYYAADGTSLYYRDETLHKMGIGSHEVEQHHDADVMDTDRYHNPDEDFSQGQWANVPVRYPYEGWQPIGQLDMEGGPAA